MNNEERKTPRCFSCENSSEETNVEKEDLIELDCPSNHFHCYSCLKNSFDQQSKENPSIRCHRIFCSYRLKSKDFQRISLRFEFDESMKLICRICFEENSLKKIFFHRNDEEEFVCFQCLNKDLIDQMSTNQLLTCRCCQQIFNEEDFLSIDFIHFARYQHEKQIEIELNKETFLLQCPNGFCHWRKQMEKNSPRIRIECPQCSIQFCSSCSDQYHYHLDCHRIPSILQHFLLFIDQFPLSSTSKIKENSQFKRRYDEFVRDEIYKSEFCRHCPSCRRLIEYSNGCQTIVCGENAHRFNQKQIGCRKIFRWFDAPFYQMNIQLNLKTIQIENQQFSFKCDRCQREMNGIRFQCIHCSSLSFCFDCHDESIDQHWKENQQRNEKEHLFSLIPF